MPFSIQALGSTAAARWRRRLWGEDHHVAAKEKSHGLTKETYYRAIIECLSNKPGKLPSWVEVVDHAHGSRSTFYTVTGGKATYPLLREYESGPERQREIAARYRHGGAVAGLIHEARVWAYWPYRVGWVHELELGAQLAPAAAAESLVRVLAQWAAEYPTLAIAVDPMPPICAVEDFLLAFPQQSAEAVVALLDSVVGRATGPLGATAGNLVDIVHRQLQTCVTSEASNESSGPNALVTQLAGTLDALGHELRVSPPKEAAKTRQLVIDLLKDAIDDLGSAENSGGKSRPG